MRLFRRKQTHLDPDSVIWPQYCLGHIPCGALTFHRPHFWAHYSGYPAVCVGVEEA